MSNIVEGDSIPCGGFGLTIKIGCFVNSITPKFHLYFSQLTLRELSDKPRCFPSLPLCMFKEWESTYSTFSFNRLAGFISVSEETERVYAGCPTR